jgi:hypothetical protein
MKNIYLALLTAAVVIFSGCSSKEYFEPENVVGSWKKEGSINQPIVDSTSSGAMLKDRKLIIKSIFSDYIVPEGYRFINESDGWIINSNIDGQMLLQKSDKSSEDITLDVKKTVAAATVKDDVLAILFANNETAIYSLSSKEMIYKEEATAPIALDARITNPYIFNDLVIFLSLDGKVQIVSAKNRKLLRSISIGKKEYFDNIIYFNMINNIMVAATPHTILSFGIKEFRENYDIRDVVYNEDGIWITTTQGEVIALDPALEVISKQKFPFAHFLGMIVKNNKVYVIEKEGYLIVLEKDLKEYKIYDADVGDGFVFVSDEVFFNDNSYINVNE